MKFFNTANIGRANVPQAIIPDPNLEIQKSVDPYLQMQNMNRGLSLPMEPTPAAQPMQEQAIGNQPYEVPPLAGRGYEAIRNAPTAGESNEATATALQNQYAAQGLFQPEVDEQGNVNLDEQGRVIPRLLSSNELAGQQEEEISALRNQSDFLTGAETNADIANNILNNALEAGFTNSTLNKYNTEQLSSLAHKSGTHLGIAKDEDEFMMFNPESKIRGPNTPEGYAAGTALFKEMEIPPEAASYLMEVMPYVGGLASAMAANQTMTYKDKPTVVSDSGSVLDDATPEIDYTNAVAHNISNALNTMGIDVPQGFAQKYALLKTAGDIFYNNLKPYTDDNGRTVLAAVPRYKDRAKALNIVGAALTGDDTRPQASNINLAGSRFRDPGFKMAKNSIPVPGATYTATELAKSILGSMPEQFNEEATLSLKNQYDSIMENYDENLGYAEGPFAKVHKVDKAYFEHVKSITKPDPDFDNSEGAKQKYKAKQEAHAREAVQNKLAEIQKDLKDSMNGLGKLWFTTYSHNVANSRFNRSNSNTDLLSGKATIRQTLSSAIPAAVSAVSAFNTEEIKRLKRLSEIIFLEIKPGEPRHNALKALSVADRSMLGLMQQAVVNYYTYTGNELNGDVAKMAEVDAIKMYTPEIATRLAELGKRYKAWLHDPKGIAESDPEIVSFIAGQKRGTHQANQNLWSDMANLQKAAGDAKKDPKQTSFTKLTTQGIDDGNQNGIMIQGLYGGVSDAVIRLGVYDPKADNMRDHLVRELKDQLYDMLAADNSEKADAWMGFIDEASKNNPSFASDLTKQPLMEHAYSKDASMFYENMYEFLSDGDYNSLFNKYFVDTNVYSTDSSNHSPLLDATQDLNSALEGALLAVVNPTFATAMKRIGNLFAVLNTIPVHKGIDGGTQQYSKTDIGFVPDAVNTILSRDITSEGIEYLTKQLGRDTTEVYGPNNQGLALNMGVKRNNPASGKGKKSYFKIREGTFEIFDNPAGSDLKRLMAVMPVQHTDADLLKIMLSFVNRGEVIPKYVATVHDSLITTMDTMHMYRNAYNNIAIPRAVPEIKKFATRLMDSLRKAEEDALNITQGEKYVGIGINGDYPAMSVFFDSLWKGLESPQFKELIQGRAKRTFNKEKNPAKRAKLDPEKRWLDYQNKIQDICKRAYEAGWIYGVNDLAVSGDQFKQLWKLVKEHNGAGEINNQLARWEKEFPESVDRAWRDLIQNESVRKHGVAQMNSEASVNKPHNSYKMANKKKAKLEDTNELPVSEDNPFAIPDFDSLSKEPPKAGEPFIPSFKRRGVSQPYNAHKMNYEEIKQKIADIDTPESDRKYLTRYIEQYFDAVTHQRNSLGKQFAK